VGVECLTSITLSDRQQLERLAAELASGPTMLFSILHFFFGFSQVALTGQLNGVGMMDQPGEYCDGHHVVAGDATPGGSGVAWTSVSWLFRMSEPEKARGSAKARPIWVSTAKPHLARCDPRP